MKNQNLNLKANKNCVLISFQNEGAPADLLLIATHIADKGFKPFVLVCPEQELIRKNINRKSLEEWVRREVVGRFPIVVGLSVYSKDVAKGLIVSEILREQAKTHIIWGGWHPTLYPESVVSSKLVDYAVIGDGEQTFLELLESISAGRSGKNISGIAYQFKGRTFVNPERKPTDYSNMKPISFEFLQAGYNTKNIYGEEQIFAGKGCPYRCKFCVNACRPRKYTAVKAETLVAQILGWYKLNGATSFRFDDDLFFVDKKRLIKLMELLEKLPFSIQWCTQCSVKWIAQADSDFLARLRKSGLYMVLLGAETASRRVLKLINKTTSNPELIIPAAKRLSDLGIIAVFNYIVGFPGETLEDIRKTFQAMERLYQIPKVVFGGPFLFRPYPGTELYQECLRLGFKESKTLEGWADIYYQYGIKRRYCPWISDETYYLDQILKHYSATKNAQLYSLFGQAGADMFPGLAEDLQIKFKQEVDFLKKPDWRRILKQRLRELKENTTRELQRERIENILLKTHTLGLARSIKRMLKS